MPTIPDLAPGYLRCGLSKQSTVRYIVDQHLRANIARGQGRRAAKRADAIKLARAYEVMLWEEFTNDESRKCLWLQARSFG